jgi:hypothetical protein
MMCFTLHIKPSSQNALTNIFLYVHDIQIMPYKQMFPVRPYKHLQLSISGPLRLLQCGEAQCTGDPCS